MKVIGINYYFQPKTKMGIIQSFVRIKLHHYRMIARAIVPPSIESASLKKKFYEQAERTPF